MTQTPYNDGSHDPVTGAYIKPEDRVSPVAAAQTATIPDPYTITEEEPTVSVGTSANEYNPDLDPRVHPELLNTGAGSTAAVYTTTGVTTVNIDPNTYADSNVIITEDHDTLYNTGTAGTAYDDPMYYAGAVDYSVDNMIPSAPTLGDHDHSELKETLDRILDQHIHLLHHQHETMQKLEEVSQKVDHLLEHMHQPMTGTLQIDFPQKVGAGYTL